MTGDECMSLMETIRRDGNVTLSQTSRNDGWQTLLVRIDGEEVRIQTIAQYEALRRGERPSTQLALF